MEHMSGCAERVKGALIYLQGHNRYTVYALAGGRAGTIHPRLAVFIYSIAREILSASLRVRMARRWRARGRALEARSDDRKNIVLCGFYRSMTEDVEIEYTSTRLLEQLGAIATCVHAPSTG
jgi:hypothetical protein